MHTKTPVRPRTLTSSSCLLTGTVWHPSWLQLSVLRLFEAVLSDVSIRRSPDFQDLISFAKHTVRNMFAR